MYVPHERVKKLHVVLATIQTSDWLEFLKSQLTAQVSLYKMTKRELTFEIPCLSPRQARAIF